MLALFDAAAVLGDIKGLVNNAGIVAAQGAFADVTAERLSRMMDVNVIGTMLCAREGVRRMAHSRGGAGGSIVNVSSRAAVTRLPGGVRRLRRLQGRRGHPDARPRQGGRRPTGCASTPCAPA